MKLIFIENLRAGMRVAKNIYLPGKTTPLIRQGAILEDSTISKLKARDIRFAYVELTSPPPTPPGQQNVRSPFHLPSRKVYIPQPKPVIQKRLKQNALISVEELFKAIPHIKDDLHLNAAQIIRRLDIVVRQLVDSLMTDENALININELKGYDEYTYHHSLSVAVLTIAIAQYIGFDRQTLNRIGMCAIMHDIGKTSVPIEIIHKNARLSESEFEIVKSHSMSGFGYLQQTDIKDDEILYGVLHHHEKLDGSGYPKGLKGMNIPMWSRIISVADVYDALTSNRPYRDPMQPAEAIEYIMGSVGTAFDYDIVQAFVHKVELYPVGSKVELSNGQMAVVLSNENQMRPVVRLVASSEILDLFRDRSCLNIVISRLFAENKNTSSQEGA